MVTDEMVDAAIRANTNAKLFGGEPRDWVRAALEAALSFSASKETPSSIVGGAELVAKIAQVAAGVGFQADVPALDIAGHILSILAANPEHIDRFMVEGTELFLDGTFNYENGSLTYRAMSGAILSPSALRAKNGSQQ